MPVDPWGSGDYYSPDQGIWYPDSGYDSGPDWYDLAQLAQQAYIYGELGYPQGPNITYAPQYPQQQQQQPPMTMPQLYPSTPTAPTAQPTQGAGVQLSTTTLIIIGLVGFAFLSGKRGR